MSHTSRMIAATEASMYLRQLAMRTVEVYKAMPTCRAILLTGSASEGVSDFYSDLDIILYYDELPAEEALVAAREQNGGANLRIFGLRTDTDFGEQYTVHGVECQFAHTTIAAWEHEIATVLVDLDIKSPIQKALGGMEKAIPLYGADLIRAWQATLSRYPDPLRDAMVKEHMAFFPLWGLHDRLEPRDATIWVHQVLVENSYNLLAILAGVNRLYFSNFQFKRMQHFIDKLGVTPANCGQRLESLFRSNPGEAAQQMETLVAETLDIVDQQMPHMDTTRARTRIGWRHPAWKIILQPHLDAGLKPPR